MRRAGPADVLTKLSHFAATNGDGSFATVLCAQLDVAAHTVTLASAGHLPPLMVASGQADYLPLRVGVPIGVGGDVDYEQLTVAVPDGATLIAFTDGLVERRDEVLDDGLVLAACSGASRPSPGALPIPARGLRAPLRPAPQPCGPSSRPTRRRSAASGAV